MRMIIAIVFACVLVNPAFAYHHRHHAYHAVHHRSHYVHVARHNSGLYVCNGCVVRDTLAGIVAVSAANADRLVKVIDDLWHAGFRGPVHCAAPYGTHVSHSLHYSGNACDFAQYGWGKTHSAVMYHSGRIIAADGLRDGCSFRDCGHVDTGFGLARRSHVHYAHHHRRLHYARQV